MAKKCTTSYTQANSCQYDWTTVATSQINPNTKNRTDWTDLGKIVGFSTGTFGYAPYKKYKKATHYTEKKVKGKDGKQVTKKVADKWITVEEKPFTLALSNFGFNIPSNAHIYMIKYHVWFKCDKNVDVKVPVGNFRISPQGNASEVPKSGKTGWVNGAYFVFPSGKVSTKSTQVTYTMDEEEYKKGGFKISQLNGDRFGLDLLFHDATFTGDTGEGNIYVEKVRCTIEYDMPNPKLELSNPVADATQIAKYTVDFDGTESKPYNVAGESDFPLTLKYTNKSKSYNTSANQVTVEVPWGSEIVSATPTKGTFNSSTNVWQFGDIVKDKEEYLYLTLRSSKRGLSNLYVHNADDTAFDNYYYFVTGSQYDGTNDIVISTEDTFHVRHPSCIDIHINGVSNDNSLTVRADCNMNIADTSFSLVSGEDVTLDSQTSDSATLTVPNNYDLVLKYCFTPLQLAYIDFTSVTTDSPTVATARYYVNKPYEYVLDLTGEHHEIKLNTHRIASEVGMLSTMIPCESDEIDKSMIMSDCQINMSIWEELDYIGCIPLEHHHFEPKSTFKDTLLNSTYKNKRYMGKKLATDEDITLNVRLHPQQVTTLQGLIEMDKPIPINANHKCFEGDALNHRGWAEVYAVKTSETNPHWYKCDIDVKYLTHNLNTRFKIDKGQRVNDYQIPSIMSETYSSGESLSQDDCYFDVDTDGTFYYADDYYEDTTLITFNDAERNSFNIDNGQHIRITSHDPLTAISNVSFTWSSVLISEDKENAVSRIIRLIQKGSNKTVFEYQYDDLEIGDDEVTGTAIYRKLNSKDVLDDYPIGRSITFRYNPSDVTYEDDTVDVETDSEIEYVVSDGEAQFGSTFKLTLNNNILSFVDEGFNGREINVEDIKLEEGEYYYQVEWINNNTDFETPSVETVFDFIVEDTILTTNYSQTFGNIVVSPFPVSDKKILFTREAEEGTIYYYQDDKEEFSYLIEPYYQYHNGTDLVTSDGISIFNLNYGYEVVYIQNGLVRLGFNRLNGRMYLGKYDPKINDYITTCQLHIEKFDDVNLNMISDDKIEVQASDCVFTIYRGHPYIKIKHELEDIYIDTVSNRVWGEQVGDESVSIPTYWDLLNDSNMLDACVGGGQGIKSSCVTSEMVFRECENTSLEWYNFPSDILVDTETTFTITGDTLSDYSDEISFDDNVCSFGEYSIDIVSDNAPHHFGSVTGSKQIIQSGDDTVLKAELLDINDVRVTSSNDVYFVQKFEPLSINLKSTNPIFQTGEKSNIQAKIVEADGQIMDNYRIDFYEIYTPSLSLGCLNPIIQTGEKANLQAKLKDEDGSLVKGVRVDFYEVYEPTTIRLTSDKSIIQSGDVANLSATLKDSDGSLISGETIYFYEKIEE